MTNNSKKNMSCRAATAMADWWKQAWKMGRDDPRKFIHAVKVGTALCMVCPLYLAESIFKGFAGKNAIWAVITVVVVFEFSAGATLCKGLNRGLGTLAAGILGLSVGFLAKHVASVTMRAIIIGLAIFLFGATVTYFRFMPRIKAKFDYGMVIFLLTFNMILMSSYRENNVPLMAYHRLATVLIGSVICLFVSWTVCPIWAGEDLHQHLVSNLQTLTTTFKDCVEKYFEDNPSASLNEEEDEESAPSSSEEAAEDPIYEGYRSILDSKAAAESLANFARWEPRHGSFRSRYPWKHYVKLGSTIRHCAYTVVALHGCLSSEIQTPKPTRNVCKKQCLRLSMEAVKLLEALTDSVEQMRQCRALEPFLKQIDIAVKSLHSAFGSEPGLFVDSNRWIVQEIPSTPSTTESRGSVCHTNSLSKIDLPNNPQLAGLEQRCVRLDTWHGPRRETPPTSPLLQNGSNNPARICRNVNELQFADAFPLATFASLMVEFTARLVPLALQVQELGRKAKFRALKEEELHKLQRPHVLSSKSRRDLVNNHDLNNPAD